MTDLGRDRVGLRRSVIRDDLRDAQAVPADDRGGIRLEYNPTRPRGRLRFSIAHEIAHHELRHRTREDKFETEANVLASELLIPRHRLRRAVDAGLNVQQLREQFEVSRDAVVYALEDANLLSRVAM